MWFSDLNMFLGKNDAEYWFYFFKAKSKVKVTLLKYREGTE